MPGSATVAIAALNNNGDLEMAIIGDCGIRIIRSGECIFATKVMHISSSTARSSKQDSSAWHWSAQ